MIPRQVDYTGEDQAVVFLDQADPVGGRQYCSCRQVNLLAKDIVKRYALP
jgi:hypothetical protein